MLQLDFQHVFLLVNQPAASAAIGIPAAAAAAVK